jgi:glucose-fructose oxidoreductase
VADDNVRVKEPNARGGGPVYDMGVYCINAARYLFGSEPTEIFAATARSKDKRFEHVEEMATVVMHFSEERLASFTCSFGASDVSRYCLIGTKGILRSDPAYEYAMAIKQQITIGEKSKTKTFPKRDQFAAQLVYFSDCILKDKQPEPSGIEGLADVRVVEAIYESAQTKKAIRMPELPDRRQPNIQQEIHRPARGKPRMVKAKAPSRKAA